MRISLIQMRVTGEKERDLKNAARLVRAAGKNDLIVLPEMFCCEYRPAAFVENAEPIGGRITDALAEMAAASGAYLVGGSMPEYDGGRIYNTCPVLDGAGRLIAKHRKAHLFDIDVKGGQRFFESETLSKGDGSTAFDTPFGRIGVAVCFDIRFTDFIHGMKGIDMLAVPAAFNMTTGPLHWELLFRARAVDEQIYTFGCAPARDAAASYVSYANSIAVDPWGAVIARAGVGEEIVSFEIDPAEVRAVRAQIPIGKS